MVYLTRRELCLNILIRGNKQRLLKYQEIEWIGKQNKFG
nr:MAG TPA: hypothetical protein [Caudoviricetes sp.]